MFAGMLMKTVRERRNEPRRQVVCSMSVLRWAAFLLYLLVVPPLPAVSLMVVPLPGNSVRLLKSTSILFHTSDIRLTFLAVSDLPHCSFHEEYEVNLRESVGSNSDLIDPLGRQWYELSYFTYRSFLIVKIYGRKSHFIPRRWKVGARCKLGMVFTFTTRNICLGTRWNSELVNNFFPEFSNNRNKSDLNIMEIQDFENFYYGNEKHYLFEGEGGSEPINCSAGEVNPIKYTYEYLPRSTTDGGILIIDNLSYIFLIVALIMMVLICMRCWLCPVKKVPKRVKTVTIVRRIPVVEPECNSPLVTVRENQQQDDFPPSYDDIELNTPPPPYNDVQNVQVLVSDMSVAQPYLSAVEQSTPEESSFVALEIVPPQQLSSITGEGTTAAFLVPITAERTSAATPNPTNAETASAGQSHSNTT